MKTRIALFAVLTLIAAACGGSSDVADTRPTSSIPITTTAAPTTTTPAPTVAPTTTATTEAPDVGVVPIPVASPELLTIRAAIQKTDVDVPARVDGLIELVGSTPELGDIDVSIPISSSFDPVTGDGHMSMDFGGLMEATGEELPPELAGVFDGFEVRQIGDTAYLKFGFFNALFGVETEWLSMPVEDGQGFTQDFATGVDPFNATLWLVSLEQAGGDVEVVGSEELRGVETTHYRVLFDLESLRQLDPGAFDDLTSSAPIDGFELPLEIWIDDQQRVHRFRVAIEAPELSGLNPGESFDHMLIQFDFSDFGGTVTVEPPPAEDVTDISEVEDFFESMFTEISEEL